MKIYTEISELEEFEPWADAKETHERICDAGKGEEFIQQLDDVYPDGITETQLNDLLWFEEEWCYSLVGLNKYGYEPMEACDIYDSNTVQDYITRHFEELNNDDETEKGRWIDDDHEVCHAIEEWLEENQDSDDIEEIAEKWLNDGGEATIEEYTYFEEESTTNE